MSRSSFDFHKTLTTTKALRERKKLNCEMIASSKSIFFLLSGWHQALHEQISIFDELWWVLKWEHELIQRVNFKKVHSIIGVQRVEQTDTFTVFFQLEFQLKCNFGRFSVWFQSFYYWLVCLLTSFTVFLKKKNITII